MIWYFVSYFFLLWVLCVRKKFKRDFKAIILSKKILEMVLEKKKGNIFFRFFFLGKVMKIQKFINPDSSNCYLSKGSEKEFFKKFWINEEKNNFLHKKISDIRKKKNIERKPDGGSEKLFSLFERSFLGSCPLRILWKNFQLRQKSYSLRKLSNHFFHFKIWKDF